MRDQLFVRLAAALLAIALHVVAIPFFNMRREREPRKERAMTLVRVAEHREAPKSRPARPANPPVSSGGSVRQPTEISNPAVSPAPPLSESSVTENFDTEKIAARAIGKLMREEGYRHLDGRKPVTVNEPIPPSIFDKPRRAPGDIDHDSVQGSTYIWHSENCYTLLEFPTLKDPNQIIGAPNPPMCQFGFGEREPRDDLFEHLKKTKPLPEAKPGVPIELAYPEKKE